jgi:AcrR family transcriptional regulator
MKGKEDGRMDQKQRIYETAFNLFAQDGYSRITVERIARSCGTGKATLYQYVSSKEQLLLDCIDYFSEKIGSEVESIVTNPNLSPEEKISEFIIPVIRFIGRINGKTALQDIYRNVPEAYQKIEENRRRLIFANIVRIVEQGKRAGVFREDVNSSLVAHILIGTVSHIGTPEVLEEMDLPAGRLLQMVLEVVWNGCRSGKNAKSAG